MEQVSALAELGRLPLLPVGTRVFVVEDERTYISVGNTTGEIASRLGWTQANVWMPEHVIRYIAYRHPAIRDPVQVAAVVLSRTASVHEDARGVYDQFYFIVPAELLRSLGLITSRTMRYVDCMIELRRVPGGALLRAFHLSPRDRNEGGSQLWP